MQNLLKKMGLVNREVIAWAAYDWANSAFATSVMVVILPIYFADVAAATLPENLRIAYWAYTAAVSIAIVATISPFLGTLADIIPWKKKFLTFFMLLGAGACMGLYFVERGDWMLAAGLYCLGTVGFAAGNAFYESMLPHICDTKDIDRVSTAGYAIGYLGGGILLALHLAWISVPEVFGISDKQEAVKLALASVGVWWIIFTLPLLIWVREPQSKQVVFVSVSKTIVQTWQQLMDTFRNIRSYEYIVLFLAAFYFFSDGIGTVMKMSTIYGRELGFPQSQLIGAMLLVQFLGVPCTFIFGPLAARLGVKQGIILCLCVYIGVCIVGFYMKEAWHFWVLAGAVAMVQGGCQALARSLYASIIPRRQSAEFFGFYSVSSRFAGILGPLVFGVLANALGHSRYSILFVISFFLIGIFIISKLDVAKARLAVQE